MPLYGRNMVIAISLVAGLGIVFEGYDQGVMSGVNISPSYIDLMQIGDGATGTITNASKQGGLVAIYYLGTLLGALLGGAISDRIGRNYSIIFGGVWGILGSSLQVAAQNAPWMLCARIIAGVGTGIISAVIPVWSSELVSHDARGMVIAFEMVVNYMGISSAYWLEYVLAFINGGQTQVRWRFPLGFQMIPLLVLMIMMFFMPESPRFDIAHGKQERGKKTLAKFRAEGNIDHPDVVAEYEEICAAIELESKFPARGFFHMVTGYGSGELHLGRRTFLAAFMQIMQAWTGVTTVVVYAPTLFTIAGFSQHKANLLTGCANLVAMVSCILAIITIDRFGRRKVLIVGGIGQSLAMWLLGALSKVGEDKNSASIGAAAGSFVFIYNFIFASTWLSVPWVYPTEIFPLAIRAKGNAFGIVGWSLGCGSVSLAAPKMFQSIGPSTFYIHAIFNIFAIVFVYCCCPETSCRTLEEIDLLFASKSLWVWDTEKRFQELKAEHSELVHGVDHRQRNQQGGVMPELEKGGETPQGSKEGERGGVAVVEDIGNGSTGSGSA